MDISFLKIDAFSSEYDHSLLSYRTKERLSKVTDPLKRKHTLYGDLLLSYVQFKKRGIYSIPSISVNAYGKPLIEHYYYNLSHSGDWIALVYSENPVGMDIQKTSAYNQKLAKFFFTHAECYYLNRLTPTERKVAFTKLWSYKESFVKARGISLYDIKNDICGPLEEEPFVIKNRKISNQTNYYVRGQIENYFWCVSAQKSFTSYEMTAVCQRDFFTGLKDIEYLRRKYGEHIHEKSL